MGILDNLEAYMDNEPEKCHYCTNKAKYTDVAEITKQGYAVIGVCQCHYVQDVS
jgi:PP-loop superfamily ATP-utilizing enzyme